jgi:hypothetical protein
MSCLRGASVHQLRNESERLTGDGGRGAKDLHIPKDVLQSRKLECHLIRAGQLASAG